MRSKSTESGEAEHRQSDPLIAESIKGFMNGFDSALLRIASSASERISRHCDPLTSVHLAQRAARHAAPLCYQRSEQQPWDSFAKRRPRDAE